MNRVPPDSVQVPVGGDRCQLSPRDPSHAWWSQDTHQPYGSRSSVLMRHGDHPAASQACWDPSSCRGSAGSSCAQLCLSACPAQTDPKDPNPQDFSVPKLSFSLQGLGARRSGPHQRSSLAPGALPSPFLTDTCHSGREERGQRGPLSGSLRWSPARCPHLRRRDDDALGCPGALGVSRAGPRGDAGWPGWGGCVRGDRLATPATSSIFCPPWG